MLSMLTRSEPYSSVWHMPTSVFCFGDFSVVVNILFFRRFYVFPVHSQHFMCKSRLINSNWVFSLKLHIGEVLTHANDIMFRIRMLSMLSRSEPDSSVWHTPASVFCFWDVSIVINNLISRRFYAVAVHS